MSDKADKPADQGRRNILLGAGATAIASAATGIAGPAQAAGNATIRWGFVGTGMIANSMARVVKGTSLATLQAVSSRSMDKAQEFASRHGATLAFDDWMEMIQADDVDAIYVATPTSVREEISIAAANAGKHVLGEKPFASHASVKRITAACRANSVALMDGTHFVHHPRTLAIKSQRDELTGWPWSVDSAFQFNLPDRNNIRYNTDLEPMGAIGDAGWYNMRAAVEYLSPDVKPVRVDASRRLDKRSGAAISGSGVIEFDDGSTTTWNCGFDSGAVVMDLRITGAKGVISIDDFLSQDPDGSARYWLRGGGWGPNARKEEIIVDSKAGGSTLMFDDFARAVADPGLREAWMRATERTQALLDAAWESATGANG